MPEKSISGRSANCGKLQQLEELKERSKELDSVIEALELLIQRCKAARSQIQVILGRTGYPGSS